MEFRVLQYFLAIAREQSISQAAEYLHISQPTLSRQIKDMEEELGKQLFIRGNRKITLTEEGMILRRRTEEIINLMKKTEKEIANVDAIISGDIYIGSGETSAVSYIATAAKIINEKYPQIHYHLSSDDKFDILEQLDKGLIDFGVIIGQVDKAKYDFIKFPVKNTWGLLMRKDAPLAQKQFVEARDLEDIPLIVSRQIDENHILTEWFSERLPKQNIIATYNLVYNASILVSKGNGYALTIDSLVNTTGDSDLCFIPLAPKIESEIYIIWKKHQIFSKACEEFIRVFTQVTSS